MTYAIKPEPLAHWAMAAIGDSGLKVEYKLAHMLGTRRACVDQPITGLPHAHALRPRTWYELYKCPRR